MTDLLDQAEREAREIAEASQGMGVMFDMCHHMALKALRKRDESLNNQMRLAEELVDEIHQKDEEIKQLSESEFVWVNQKSIVEDKLEASYSLLKEAVETLEYISNCDRKHSPPCDMCKDQAKQTLTRLKEVVK